MLDGTAVSSSPAVVRANCQLRGTSAPAATATRLRDVSWRASGLAVIVARMARVADIAGRLRERQRVYQAAWATDLRRLRAEHGQLVDEALQMVAKPVRNADHWDRAGHRRAVERGIERVIAEHHEQHDDLPELLDRR